MALAPGALDRPEVREDRDVADPALRAGLDASLPRAAVGAVGVRHVDLYAESRSGLVPGDDLGDRAVQELSLRVVDLDPVQAQGPEIRVLLEQAGEEAGSRLPRVEKGVDGTDVAGVGRLRGEEDGSEAGDEDEARRPAAWVRSAI